MTEYTYSAGRWARGKHQGPGPWLDVIHATNRLAAELGALRPFDAPTIVPSTDTTPYTEVYPAAHVEIVHHDPEELRTDDYVTIIPTPGTLTADLVARADAEVMGR